MGMLVRWLSSINKSIKVNLLFSIRKRCLTSDAKVNDYHFLYGKFLLFYYQIFSSSGQRVDVVDRELEVFIGILLFSVILRGISRSSRVASNSELSAAVSERQFNDRIRIQLKIIIIKSPSRKFLIDAKFIENFNYLQIFTQHEHKIPQNELHPWNILPRWKKRSEEEIRRSVMPVQF